MTLPDTIAACNRIKCHREYHRRAYISKSITFPIEVESNIRARTMVRVNRYTDNVLIAHNLSYGWICFYPTTNQKLRCTNQHALDMLKQRRDGDRGRYYRKKKIIGGHNK